MQKFPRGQRVNHALAAISYPVRPLDFVRFDSLRPSQQLMSGQALKFLG